MRRLIFALAFAAAAAAPPQQPPAAPPNAVSLSTPADTPVVVTRPTHTVSVYADRVVVAVAGSRPFTVLFDAATPPPTPPNPDPKPPPKPPPTPPTPPNPDPNPTPAGYDGPLWGVLVLPDALTPPLAALRTAPEVEAAFKARNAVWRSYLAGEAEVQAPGYVAALAKVPPPAVVWIGENGKVLSVTAAKDAAGVTNELIKIRGGK